MFHQKSCIQIDEMFDIYLISAVCIPLFGWELSTPSMLVLMKAIDFMSVNMARVCI